MKTFLQFINESRAEAAKNSDVYKKEAERHKAEADKHPADSYEHHRAMGNHHNAMMKAARSEGRSKWLIADRSVSTREADHHFNKAMHHHNAATDIDNKKNGL